MKTEIKGKKYDLEDRTLKFAKDVRSFIKKIPRSISSFEDGKQVLRSSGSIGANYIEANEALGKKDFLMKLRTSRKEAKESRYWLNVLDVGSNEALVRQQELLTKESDELMKIFGAIVRKLEN